MERVLRRLNFSVFANGKWVFTNSVPFTPLPVKIFDSLACVRCVWRFTFRFKQCCVHTWRNGTHWEGNVFAISPAAATIIPTAGILRNICVWRSPISREKKFQDLPWWARSTLISCISWGKEVFAEFNTGSASTGFSFFEADEQFH